MAKIEWDLIGDRLYETGVDHGVLYIPNNVGQYTTGVAWNGLTGFTESPSGAESNPQYADNMKYLNLISAEDFGGTLEAFYFPKEFEQFDGFASPSNGVSIGQQGRRAFGFSYRTLKGNDVDNLKHGYKIHLLYNLTAAPSERAYTTVNESPEAMTFSWTLSATPVPVPGYDPAASITIDSTEVDPVSLAALEQILYGTAGVNPRLPMPAEVIAMFDGVVTVVVPLAPAFDGPTNTLTIPTVVGVEYLIDGLVVPAGNIVIDQDVIVTARPTNGYVFSATADDDWAYEFV